jgi:hypothetical protein
MPLLLLLCLLLLLLCLLLLPALLPQPLRSLLQPRTPPPLLPLSSGLPAGRSGRPAGKGSKQGCCMHHHLTGTAILFSRQLCYAHMSYAASLLWPMY